MSTPPTPAATPHAVPRLLIVDDEVAHMRALCDTLRTEGFDTVGFPDGPAALEAFEQGAFDLLLTDLAMPGMDGIEVLKEVLRRDPDVVGIIMTGEGTIATAVEAMKVGALDYILKPFRLSVVLPVLGRALSVRRLRLENADLHKRLAERAAALEAANKELDSFTHSVSHDLRGPLRAVIGFSTIVASDYAGPMADKGREYLNDAISAAKRMDRLIEDLLGFARLNHQQLTKRRFDMAALVHEVLGELAREREGRAVDVVVGELPEANADRALMKQVLTNLLSNAFKFTGKRERAVVEIGSRREVNQVVYYVRDNGAGFDMKHATKLFGAFQRMHRQDEFEGTGVGLSLAHRIVVRHGGRMWADAVVDQGTTFFFTVSS